MKKLVFGVIILVFIGAGLFFLRPYFFSSPNSNLIGLPKGKIEPSTTFIEYVDPVGFSFSYPDNLSIEKLTTEDPSTYTDLQLYSKDVNGSLNIKIVDSKLKSLDEWVKQEKATASSKEVKLGNLDAKEATTSDRLMLGALDQGVLFTVDMPLLEQDFWGLVYQKVISGFTFVSPETIIQDGVSANSGGDEVIFEGEEVVE